MLAMVAAIYLVELAFSHPALMDVVEGATIPNLSGEKSVYLAAGILGATVMPHVIYLHSALSRSEKQTFIRRHREGSGGGPDGTSASQ
jgi:manganese transport protein